jgi:hypothetical protein
MAKKEYKKVSLNVLAKPWGEQVRSIAERDGCSITEVIMRGIRMICLKTSKGITVDNRPKTDG